MENPQQVHVPDYNPTGNRTAKKSKECINRKLIPPKILLMTFYGALGCLLPFLTLHMKHLGLTHDEITWINTVLPITSLLGPPVAGYIADRSGKHKLITIFSMMLAALFHLMLLFVPPTHRTEPHPPPMQLWCGSSGSHLAVVPCTVGDDGPCHQYDGSLKMTASFRLSNCRYHCKDTAANSTAFLLDGSGTAAALQASGGGDADFDLPSIEQYVPSYPPHICPVYASKILNCIVMNEDNSSFTYESSLLLDSGVAVGDQATQTCQFKQDELSSDGIYYEDLVCKTEDPCRVVCDATEETNGTRFLQNEECEGVSGNSQLTFWIYFLVRALADLFPAILISLLDAMMLTMVTQYNGDFGRQKMFGLVAVGMTAPIVGWLMDGRIGSYGNLTYGPVFYVFTALMIVSAIITLFLPFEMELRTTSFLKSLSTLFKNTELVMLFVIMSVLGSFWSFLETFLYIHLQYLSAPNFLIGLTITIGIVPSMPFLFKSERIVNYCGHHHLLMIAFIMYCIRFIGFAHMTNPWWSMPLEVLELFTLNMLQVAAATLAFQLAPKSLVATAQAFVFIAHFTIGRCVGAFVSGMFIDLYGIVCVFVGAGVLSGAIAAIYFTTYYCVRWHNKKRTRKPCLDDKPQPALQQQNANGNISNGTYRPIPLDDRI